ncbi:MAG: PAS domain S-box protein [Proteobacteria bacterium]|nr:PAS domain S-box protein [Pseudomonadota bacterium]
MESMSFTAIIDFLPDATFVIDRGGKVIAWNRAIEEMTGVKKEDILGKGDYAYAIPFYGNKRPLLIDFVLANSREPEGLYNYVKQYGNTIYAEAYAPGINKGIGGYLWGTAAPLLDDNGDCQGAIESIRDITKRVIIEKKLSESEEKLRIVFDQTFQFMGLLNIDGIIISANKTALEFIGASETDVVGKYFWETPWWGHSKETQNKLRDAVKRAATGELVRFETTHIDKNNTLHYIEFSLRPIMDKDGNIIYLNPEGLDVTDIKKTEKTLKESEEKYRAIFNSVNDAVFIHDLETGAIVDVNNRMCEMYGYTREEALKTSVTDLSSGEPPYAAQDAQKWLYEASTGEPQLFEWQAKDKNGHLFRVEINMRRALIGEHERILLTVRDIRERKKAEEALKIRDAELEIKSINLEEMNTALKVLLKERGNDKIELEEKIVTNVKELVFPYIDKLKKCRLDSHHMTYVEIIESSLNDITSPFLQKIGSKYARLTPTEIQIANLVKSGKTTKEIGEVLNMSLGAIHFHRNNIRKKLGLNNEKVNLTSYLSSL